MRVSLLAPSVTLMKGMKMTTVTRKDKIEEAAGADIPINEGDEIDLNLEVVSVKEKYGKWGPSWSIMAKTDTDAPLAFWHRRSTAAQAESPLNVGDRIDIEAKVSGKSADQKTIFLEKAIIKNKDCTHRNLSLNGEGYRCAGCGSPFKGSV